MGMTADAGFSPLRARGVLFQTGGAPRHFTGPDHETPQEEATFKKVDLIEVEAVQLLPETQ